MAQSAEQMFAARRRPQSDEALGVETMQWLQGLPADVRPRLLPVDFPRIANAFARRWGTPSFCLAYFDELMVDRRGTRRGFPLPVMLEIAALKSHFQTIVHPMPITAWGEIMHRTGV